MTISILITIRLGHACVRFTVANILTKQKDTGIYVLPARMLVGPVAWTLPTMNLYHSNSGRFETYSRKSISKEQPSSFVQHQAVFFVLRTQLLFLGTIWVTTHFLCNRITIKCLLFSFQLDVLEI